MTALYGQAFEWSMRAQDDQQPPAVLLFVTDGKQVQIVTTPYGREHGWDPPSGQDGLAIFQDRIEWALGNKPDGTDPSLMLSALGYNMPLTIISSEEVGTFEEALAAAQDQANSTAEGATA